VGRKLASWPSSRARLACLARPAAAAQNRPHGPWASKSGPLRCWVGAVGAHTWPAFGAADDGGLVTERRWVLLPTDSWTKERMPGNKRWLVEHRSGVTPEEVDFTGERQHSDEGGRCSGRWGSQQGSVCTVGDEEGAATKKRRWEVLGGVGTEGIGSAAGWRWHGRVPVDERRRCYLGQLPWGAVDLLHPPTWKGSDQWGQSSVSHEKGKKTGPAVVLTRRKWISEEGTDSRSWP
jgi:hypothetical protein